MTRAHCLAVLTMAFALTAGGFSPSQAANRQSGVCNPAAADALAGKNRISSRKAKHLTGATLVRQIKPGQGVTMDYRRERVTIETDPRTRKIVRAFCG
jgi:hypothetical protein